VAWLPVLDSMNHMRLTLLVGFAGSVLAGIGLDHLPVASAREKGLVVGSAWLLVGGLFAWSGSVLGPTLEDVEGTLEWVLEQWLVLLGAAALLSLLAVAPARPTVRALCVLGLALDLSWFAKDYNPSIDRAQYYPSTPGIELLRRDSDVFRVMALGRVLPPNSGMPYGLSDVRGQDFMTIRRYEELLTGEAGDFFFLDWVSSLLPIHRFLNVKYVVGKPDAELPPPHFERIYHGEMSIFRVHPFVERALILRDPELVEGREAALARARSHGLSMSDSLVLESPPSPTALRPRPAPQADSISVAEFAPDRLTVEAALTEPGFVLLLDTHFPGWKAFSDDTPLPIERANYAFRAVALPAGTWTLELEYRPVSFSLGVMVALSTALWLLSVLVVNRIVDRSR